MKVVCERFFFQTNINQNVSADRSQLRLLVANNHTVAINAKVEIIGWKPPDTALTTVLVASERDAANPPFSKTISPKSEIIGWNGTHSFPALSVSVVLLNGTTRTLTQA